MSASPAAERLQSSLQVVPPEPPNPLGDAPLVVRRAWDGQVRSIELEGLSDAAVPEAFALIRQTDWLSCEPSAFLEAALGEARVRRTLRFFARAAELRVPGVVAPNWSRLALQLSKTDEHAALLGRLAVAHAHNLSSIRFHGVVLSEFSSQKEAEIQQLLDRVNAAVGKLDALHGLHEAKLAIHQLKSAVVMNRVRELMGLPAIRPSFHAAFIGNPGTGKTTVARCYGEILKELGYLPSAKFVEADRASLVGEYLGSTALKTTAVLKKARGGVLFIDEAYALASPSYDKGDAFGDECVSTLLKYMEDHRDELVVILAGYPEEMAQMLESNPGLKSRIGRTLIFGDYPDETLTKVLVAMATEMGFTVSMNDAEAVVERLSGYRGTKEFANARSVRNVLELAIQRQAQRLERGMLKSRQLPTEAELKVLSASDLGV